MDGGDPLSNLLVITVVIFILVILWAVSIGVTYWDAASRRKLPGAETAAWIALVVLIPGIGFAAYLFSRLLGSALSPKPTAAEQRHRVTMIKPRFEPNQRSGTIPAAEYLKPYTTETLPAPTPEIGADQGTGKYILSIVIGPNIGDEYILQSFPIKIGRGPDVTISLKEDLGVSRLHAEIYEQTGVLRIRDLNSTHGTKVNGFSINDKSLEPGDQIQVGASILRLGIQEGSQ